MNTPDKIIKKILSTPPKRITYKPVDPLRSVGTVIVQCSVLKPTDFKPQKNSSPEKLSQEPFILSPIFIFKEVWAVLRQTVDHKPHSNIT